MAKKAFIIGINALGLSYCGSDANLMSECLEKRGYQVINRQEKLDKWVILEEFEAFLEKSNKIDTIIFYFSGHGLIDGGKLFLILDNDLSKSKNKIQINNITDPLQNCIANNKLIILDCCHAGRVNTEWKPDPTDSYRILIASCPFGTIKELDDLSASFLTHRIHQALVAPTGDVLDSDGIIRINALSNWIRKEAETHNSRADSKKISIPYLIGNDSHNFEIASLTSDEFALVKDNAILPITNQNSLNHSSKDEERRYMDQTTSIADFDEAALNRFRTQLRIEIREMYPEDMSSIEFLAKANLLENGYLTRTGVLLFGENPVVACKSAVTQCYKYHGPSKSAMRNAKQLSKTIPDQIIEGRDFVALNIRKIEGPVADSAESQVIYEYPMICVREIIANAFAHRDYEDGHRFVHITLFSDRIEIKSPGNWFDVPMIDGEVRPLDALESPSIKRNTTLAYVLSWAFFVEGEGSGIPKAIEDCKIMDAPIPNVIQKNGFVTVTIWPCNRFLKLLSKANYCVDRVPHQIPPPPVDFKGREDELGCIQSNFAKGATITGLRGMGGIGKTALALALAERLKEHFSDGQIFLDLHGTSLKPIEATDAMVHIIRSYLGPDASLPEDLNLLSGLYHSVLSGKKALILLDNAASSEQVEQLLPPTGSALLITSRRKFVLPGLNEVDLNILPLDDAKQLILKIAGRIGDHAEDLAKLCGCLPIALLNAAYSLKESPNLSPDGYIKRLADATKRMELVKASFTISYDLLTPTLQRLWSMLSVFPADFDLAGAAAVWEMDETPAEDALGELIRWSLVDFLPSAAGEGGRYKLHDLARDFADARMDLATKETAMLRHARHYRDLLSEADEYFLRSKEGVLKGLQLFDQEKANILAGQSWAERNLDRNASDVIDLCQSYPNAGAYVLDLRLFPREKIHWLETALQACRMLKGKAAEGYHLGNLGNAYSDLGEPRKAIEFYEQALAISKEIRDRRGEGNRLSNLGNAYSDLGEPRKAIEFYEQALAISREIGDRRGEGANLGNLGLAYYHLGEPRKAIEFYEQALEISRAIGDRQGEGADMGNLGNAYSDLGEPKKAIEFYEQALAISREIGDRRGEGNHLFSMSLSLQALGQQEKAIPLAKSALAIYEQIESPNAEIVRRALAEWSS
jgi:tetratricopeptide (TPR) repeat protein